LQDEDSFCKTAMSRREDILRCIDVTIMDRSAHTALPSSYSKTLPALRAGAAVTHATGLGGKRFVDFLEPHACVSAFIRQHGSKRTPPRIEHRLDLSGLRQSGGVHVANEHSTVARARRGSCARRGGFFDVAGGAARILRRSPAPPGWADSRRTPSPAGAGAEMRWNENWTYIQSSKPGGAGHSRKCRKRTEMRDARLISRVGACALIPLRH
jgi:hypothetical protein